MLIGVTGGTGFIGQYLLRDYGKDYEFVVPIRDKSKIRNEKITAEFIESDYTVDSLKEIFKGCDAVIHLAGKVFYKSGEVLTLKDYMSNVMISASVFEACSAIGITNVVYASSRAVWGEKIFSVSICEEEIPRPENEYGISKLCGDMLAQFYNENYGMKIKCYRISEICGYDLKRGMLNPFWSVLLDASVNGKSIPIYGRGMSGRDIIYVKDVTRALILGIDSDVQGIYNIGMGQIIRNIEIAEIFCKVFNNTNGVELYLDKKEQGTTKCLNVEKATKELGFKAEYDLLQIVEDIKREYYNTVVK